MKRRMGKKWLAVGLIWSVVLAMTGWNIHLVDQVQSRRQEMGTLRMDMRFIEANQAGILEVRQQKTRRVHSVNSFGMGFVVVENNLKRLSWDFSLAQMRIEVDKSSHDSRFVPISIFTAGTVPAMIGWIAAVEDAYPYLVIERMEISCNKRNGQSQLQATFNYHYSLSEPELRS